MCGIIGIAATRPIGERAWLVAGRDAMAHRGPNDAGIYWSEDGRVGMGHRRLSIIDLSSAGHQPMTSLERTIVITFNGEIYNYRELKLSLENAGHKFRSSSDTEVILAAYKEWGRDCVKKFNGMFAFAIFDIAHNRLFLARDRAGEKPLFYRYDGHELRFASELKALLADPLVPRVVDRRALDCYLSMAYVPADLCILTGMNKLPAAHAAVFDLTTGKYEVWRYWSLPEPQGTATPPATADLVSELEGLLESSVRRQLVADVPVGLLLSGGVDSSLITAFAARNCSKVSTYTVGFKGHPLYDESKHAELIAKHFATEHTLLEASEATPDILKKLAWQYDEPMVDSSMIPTFLVTEQISRQCTVALGGDGGDELFGGYHSASRMAQLQQRYAVIPLALRRIGSAIARKLLPFGSKGQHFLSHIAADFSRDVPPFMPQFDANSRALLMANYSRWPLVAENIRSTRIPSEPDGVQRVTRFDFNNYLPEDILVKVDRASMLNSLEVRSPFLDQDLIEFAFRRVPSTLKATPGDRKIILKMLAQKVLPREFDLKRKMGFAVPLGTWLRDAKGDWRTMFEDVLLDPHSTFSRSQVAKVFGALDEGRPVQEHLFGLALFELWRKQHGVSL